MIRAAAIRHLRTASPDYDETESLKAEFRKLREERSPFFLAADELDRVFRWKLRSQYERGRRKRARNTGAAYRAVTEAAFRIVETNVEYEAEVRLGLLVALPGIGVPVASAILALGDPQRYCVIDFRGWRAIYGEDRRAFSITDYLRYRTAVGTLAAQLDWPVQEADLAVWEYDRRRSQRRAARGR